MTFSLVSLVQELCKTGKPRKYNAENSHGIEREGIERERPRGTNTPFCVEDFPMASMVPAHS